MHHRFTGRQSLPSDTYRTDIAQTSATERIGPWDAGYPVLRSLTAGKDVEWGAAIHRTAHDVTACGLAGWLVPQQAVACSVWVMLRLEWVVCEFVTVGRLVTCRVNGVR
jgi:hypothetical protein